MKYDEVSTEQLAANLEKQVNALRDTVAFNFANVQIPVNKVDGLHPSCTTLVDDLLESAHSREKAELQKALAARIGEVQNLAADVAYERVKNKTQAESIGQCLDEIDRLKRLVALRTQDLAVYQKELEVADNRADKAECYSKFRLAYMCKRIDLERIKRSKCPMWFKLFVRLLFPIGLIVTWLINAELEDEHDRIVALYERYFGDLS